MKYLISEPSATSEAFTRDEVQKLLEERKINYNTEIWTEHWGKWKKLRDTDFNPDFKEEMEKEDTEKEEELNIGLILLSLIIPIAGFILCIVHYRSSRINAVRYGQCGALGIALAGLIKFLIRNYSN